MGLPRVSNALAGLGSYCEGTCGSHQNQLISIVGKCRGKHGLWGPLWVLITTWYSMCYYCITTVCINMYYDLVPGMYCYWCSMCYTTLSRHISSVWFHNWGKTGAIYNGTEGYILLRGTWYVLLCSTMSYYVLLCITHYLAPGMYYDASLLRGTIVNRTKYC